MFQAQRCLSKQFCVDITSPSCLRLVNNPNLPSSPLPLPLSLSRQANLSFSRSLCCSSTLSRLCLASQLFESHRTTSLVSPGRNTVVRESARRRQDNETPLAGRRTWKLYRVSQSERNVILEYSREWSQVWIPTNAIYLSDLTFKYFTDLIEDDLNLRFIILCARISRFHQDGFNGLLVAVRIISTLRKKKWWIYICSSPIDIFAYFISM